MELSSALQCQGCGSSNVSLDPATRMLVCHQCGGQHSYSRSALNANGKVAFSRENAINFFKEGKFDNSRHYALEVLSISKDNAPALYIIAYYDEFVSKRTGVMKRFFQEVLDIPLEYDEVDELKELMLSSAVNLLDYEEEILQLIAINQQSPQEAEQLCQFIDLLCPYFIKKRSGIVFLTKSLIEIYKELAAHCDIPKTCFALLKAIDENPDSPYLKNTFYLSSNAKYFFDYFVVPVGEIIGAIRTAELKQKFVSYYSNKKQKYMEDANI